ncbi:MAG: M20/M25/M40 family metallo-hydrolase [Patescibacteria group bacterium]
MIPKEQLQKTFIELMMINEIYPNENEVLIYTKKRLTDAGVAWEDDSFRNIVAKIPGQGEAILLSTHLDIPEPLPNPDYTIDGDVIRSNGTGILGADPKTGLAVLIEFLAVMAKRDHSTHRPIEVLLTRGEETGLLGALQADYSLLSAKIGLVLDEDGPVTQVVIKAPAMIKMDATIIGKIVHPREPENGINALHAACDALMSLPWGYSTEGVTWNVGIFQSGTARNSVPGSVTFQAELRSFETEKALSEMHRVTKTIEDVVQKHGAKCEIKNTLEFSGYALTQDHPLFERLEKTFASMSLKPNYFETFGGSDATVFNAKGIRCVPIGSGYYNAHQYTEEANIQDMQTIGEFLDQFVKND